MVFTLSKQLIRDTIEKKKNNIVNEEIIQNYPNGKSEKILIDKNTDVPALIHDFGQKFDTQKQDFKFINNGLFGFISYDSVKYFEDVAVIPMIPPERRGDPVAHLMDTGHAAIGTPDEVIKQVEGLWESSQGGFGCFLTTDHNWTSREAKLKSYELIARHVFPHFQGHNVQREASNAWVRESQKDFKESHFRATDKQIERHNKEQEAKAKPKSAAAE